MSLTGKSTKSIRKKDVKEQKSLSLGFKKTQFAHKAVGGETGINLNTLTAPTEMSSLGFTNPNTSDLLSANIFFYRKNFTLVSSLRGELIQDLSYSIRSSNYIRFEGFTAEPNEIFVGIIDSSPSTAINVVDGSPIVAIGDLLDTTTDFNVGTAFQSGQDPQKVMVYRNGILQKRNTNNSNTILDGDYYELDSGDGTSIVIRFNVAASGQDDPITVMSVGVLAEKPTASQLQEIERVQGQIDAMIPDLAIVSGNPETNYQAAPNNVDLKQFGDLVYQLSRQVNQVGDVVQSMLDEATFNSQRVGTWVLMDGQNVAGTAYETLTGNATVPNALGTALRMKDHGATGRNPDGDLNLGAYQADAFASHDHGGGDHTHTDVATSVVTNGGVLGTFPVWNINGGVTGNRSVSSSGNIIAANGGNETRMKSVTVNFFIRVD